MSTPPRTVHGLVEQLSASTLDAFLSGWLDDANRTSTGAASVEALAVWDHMERIGVPPPDWVAAAHAAAHYAREGHDL